MNSLVWQVPVAKCARCGTIEPMSRIIFGQRSPLAPYEHFCKACAKKLRISEVIVK